MGLKRNTILDVLQKINELIFIHKDNLVIRFKNEYKDITIFDKMNRLINDRSKSLKLQKALK